MPIIKHTPGPWHWEKAQTKQHLQNSKGSCFAQISMPNPDRVRESLIQYRLEMQAQYKADAALIAAAPDLLKALKHLVDMFHPEHFGCTEAIAAIKKAEGE